ncbi:MAG: hypothetical protein BWX84_00136 [Verrucomicrobia bacterium ADurb.Bin118]|nr:MAG: hypothetical protein BWX84_00136 [Verrucomicrobia bacterium ADurb.Bin118]
MIFVPSLHMHQSGRGAQQATPVACVKSAVLTRHNQRRPSGHGGVIVARSERGHAVVAQRQRSAPGVGVVCGDVPGNFTHDVRIATTEILREFLAHIVDATLIVCRRETGGIEKDDRSSFNGRPMLGRDEREEIANAFVEPTPPRGGGEIHTLPGCIVLQRGRIIEHADARRLGAFRQQRLAGGDQRWQS